MKPWTMTATWVVSVDCKRCGATCAGSTPKRAYTRFAFHLFRHHRGMFSARDLIVGVWQLWRSNL